MRSSFPRIRPIAQPQRLTRQQLRERARDRARRAWRQLAILVPLATATLLAFHFRQEWFGTDKPIRIAAAIVMLIIGWGIARGLGRALQARFSERLDPGTGGVLSFVVRLITIAAILLIALRIAGLKPSTLALGASFTAVVFGLGAQQTIGNIIAGIMLVSARPFGIGDRVRFNGFGMDVEGTVVSHGLLYVTCSDGADLVLVPNTTALTMSVRPIREPAGVDMRARLPKEIDPEAVQDRIGDALTVTTRGGPVVHLEEFDGDDVAMRIQATPVVPERGAVLAREVLRTVTAIADEHAEREGRHERRPEPDPAPAGA